MAFAVQRIGIWRDQISRIILFLRAILANQHDFEGPNAYPIGYDRHPIGYNGRLHVARQFARKPLI